MKLPGLAYPPNNLLPLDGTCVLYEEFLSSDETAFFYKEILAQTNWQQYQIQLFGKKVDQPRLTAWYGSESYTYSGLKLEPQEMGDPLTLLHKKVETQCKHKFNSVLLNLYRDGRDSMGWHSDDENELGPNPTIASVSIGAERLFHLRHKTNKEKKLRIMLTNGSLLLMSGNMQHHWQHAIPKLTRNIEPRLNLTFRLINPK